MENTNIRMVIFLKENILKTKKEDMVNIFLLKEDFCNLNLTLVQHKYLKYIYQMVHFILANKKMVHGKVLVKLLILIKVFTKENGKMIRNMEMAYSNILIIQNMMVNGKMIYVQVMVHITIQMAINIRETG